MSEVLTVRIKLTELTIQRITPIDSQYKCNVIAEPVEQNQMVSLVKSDRSHPATIEVTLNAADINPRWPKVAKLEYFFVKVVHNA